MVSSRGSAQGDIDLVALGEERDFLLRSLRDLEAEHDVHDIDDVDFETLRDDYTARAAEVLRAIERAKQPVGRRGRPRVASPPVAAPPDALVDDGEANPAPGDEEHVVHGPRRPKNRWRLVAILATVALFGVIAVWAVTATSGSRVSGQSITGNSNLRSPSAAPAGVNSDLARAAALVTKGKIGDALKLYDQVLAGTPGQPEAEANSGWLIAQTGLAVNPTRTDLIDEGLTRITAAEKAAPTYADPHFFRGFLLLRAKNDPVNAVTELRIYLGTVDPSSPQVPAVEQVLKQAIAAAGPNVPPGPNAPNPAVESPATTTTAGP